MNNSVYKPGIRLGILGGGQLGQMLLSPCINYGVDVSVLDPNDDAPCSKYVKNFIKGSFQDYDTVINFGRNQDIITIEIEHVNIDALFELQKTRKKVYPDPTIIKMIQDKGLQKEFYKINNIPTADFVLINNKEEISNFSEFLPAFQKKRKDGYDGRGVKLIKDVNSIDDAFEGESLLEKKVNFEKEIAIIVARNAQGQISIYNPVELVFNSNHNLLDYLISPASISKTSHLEADNIARRIVESLNYIGLLAIEMFLLPSGELLVNEMAPRPHNSGHQTIEGNITSQYEQHLRAILGLSLGDSSNTCTSVMLNLLGEDGHFGQAFLEGSEALFEEPNAHLHLYGKNETKPARKMGHITICGKNEYREQLIIKAHELKSKVKIISKI